MNDAINIILEGLGASNLIPTFNENNISLNTLSLLNEADLIALGIENKQLRENILKHGQSKANSVPKDQYVPMNVQYIFDILTDSNRHMLKLESNLLTSYIRINRSERLVDPLVAPNLYSSQAIHQSIKVVTNNLESMETELKELEALVKNIA